MLYRVHRKKGQPFALIPSQARAQARFAPLLPAQSRKARLYRLAVQWMGRSGILFPSEEVRIPFSPHAPMVSFLREVSQSEAAPLLLLGNPHGAAPRLIFLCLDGNDHPVGVIKAGQTAPARELIRREHTVLQQLNTLSLSRCAPRPFDLVETDDVSAFGMEFVPGEAPRWPARLSLLESVLKPWIDDSRLIQIADLPLWKTLEATLKTTSATVPSNLMAFAQTSIHPTWFHGDFAPWNVRALADDTWSVIDWERGEPNGVPGWDWLHFVIQPAILVKRWSAERILADARYTVHSPEFQRYLAKAFPHTIPAKAGDLLLRSYLLYNWHVLKPTEGREVQDALAL